MMRKSLFKKLCAIVGKDYCTAYPADLVCYSYDATPLKYLPDAVVFPEKPEDISLILQLANEERFPVVPRGAGTGMTGGSLPTEGGVVLVMTRMNNILNIDTENMVAEVEPGVITGQLQHKLETMKLFYPPDPSSAEYSTIGGNVAECAGGARAVKYGVTRDYILGLSVVLPTGEIIRTGVVTAKGVVGYDLTRLIVGSEGTLGVIVKVIMRLLPLPESVCTILAIFDHMEQAAGCVSGIMSSGTIPRTLEYMDQSAIQCVESFRPCGLPVDAGGVLIIETDGTTKIALEQIAQLAALCQSHGARLIKKAENKEEAKNLWMARKSVSQALYRLGSHKINEDIVVPRNKIPDLVKYVELLQKETGLTMVTFGHAGDGNIHFNIMLDKNDKAQVSKAYQAIASLFHFTVAIGGTLSGEHGVGVTKRSYLKIELSDIEINLMKNIKKTFDPNNILNPGKIFPYE
ncbi:MAG: FAD-linked oxidase C-terminal domain-containing protein [Pseudomonadota bacterium]